MTEDKRFKVGDTVFHAVYEQQEVVKPCTVCFGKLKVVLILGNDLPCEYCHKGHVSPTGVEHVLEFVQKATKRVITSVSVLETQRGEKREYHSDAYVLRDEDVFATEEEALARSAERAAVARMDMNTRTEYIKYDAKKSFAWNAGYHRRAVRDAQERIKYHSKMAVACQEETKK